MKGYIIVQETYDLYKKDIAVEEDFVALDWYFEKLDCYRIKPEVYLNLNDAKKGLGKISNQIRNNLSQLGIKYRYQYGYGFNIYHDFDIFNYREINSHHNLKFELSLIDHENRACCKIIRLTTEEIELPSIRKSNNKNKE